MVDLTHFAVEDSTFGPVTVARETPPGIAAFFTGSGFEGLLNDGIAGKLTSWMDTRFGISAPLSTCHQVHGTTARRVEPAGEWREVGQCDALWIDSPRGALAIKVADCVALLMADVSTGVAVGIHAGWRGAAAGIVPKTVEAVRAQSDLDPSRLRVWIGPAIRQCCFEVGEEVIETIEARRPLSRDSQVDRSRGEKPYLDLVDVVIDDLTGAGVPPASIADAGACTQCDETYHSYRRASGRSGRNLGILAIDRDLMEKA